MKLYIFSGLKYFEIQVPWEFSKVKVQKQSKYCHDSQSIFDALQVCIPRLCFTISDKNVNMALYSDRKPGWRRRRNWFEYSPLLDVITSGDRSQTHRDTWTEQKRKMTIVVRSLNGYDRVWTSLFAITFRKSHTMKAWLFNIVAIQEQ